MKILIGYDGSESADAALEDLDNAGLSGKAEAKVLSMADVIIPPPIDEEIDNAFPMHVPAGVKRAHERAERKLKEAESKAKGASEKIKELFPEWQVSHQALADSPAWSLVSVADEWHADLIVVGAQGRSALGGRFILGSVSQRVLYEAKCSVRVARDRHREAGSPLRLLVAADNSPDANAAIAEVSRRAWPAGTQVRLLTVVDTVMAIGTDPSQPSEVEWIEVAEEENWDRVRAIFEPAAERLRATGLDAAVMIVRGNPKQEVVSEAESWAADCIFVGATGNRGFDRLFQGSVSSAVSSRAPCSVEVVRPKKSLG